MRPRDVHRGIKSRHTRSGGDGPGIGKVSRLHKTDLFVGRPRRRSSRSDAAKNKAVIIWSTVLGGGTLCVLAVAFFMWMLPWLRRSPSGNSLASEERDLSVRVVSKFPSPSQEESITLVKQALGNRDPDQVGLLFRMGSSSVEEILGYCADAGNRDGKFTGYQWLSSLDTDELLVEGVVVSYETEDKKVNQRLALLTPDAFGKWQVDFESFARKVEPSWDMILDQGAEEALVRVMVAQDYYYNGPFRDESEWTSYVMNSPDMDVLLRGYCRKDSPEADTMKKMFPDEVKSARATLKLRRVEGGEKHQFEITRVLARDWILPEDVVEPQALPN